MITGTALKIKVSITVDGGGEPDSVGVVIYDPNGVIKDQGEMELDGNAWKYIYQSNKEDTAGTYVVVVNAIKGESTASTTKQQILSKSPQI